MSSLSKPLRVTHLISGLGIGGAEMMLYKLIKATQGKTMLHHVISLSIIGEVGEKIRQCRVPVVAMGFHSDLTDLLRLPKLRAAVAQTNPDIIQTWMYHADFLGALLFPGKVIWNVQNGALDRKHSRFLTRFLRWSCARMSQRPAGIVYCAESARAIHEGLGYRNPVSTVIANGINTTVFKPNPQARLAFRKQQQIADDVRVIGHVGRFDPQKGYATLLAAFARAYEQENHVHFVLCGKGLTTQNQGLMALLPAGLPAEAITFLGPRNDIAGILPALDIFVLSSAYGEAFPNVLGEAMACGVACVSTDVGDARRILADAGVITPVGDETALADGIGSLLRQDAMEKQSLKQKARSRIVYEFGLDRIVSEYTALYRNNKITG
jgi:glycosyltransferase involved in cell wall biosynthesis